MKFTNAESATIVILGFILIIGCAVIAGSLDLYLLANGI